MGHVVRETDRCTIDLDTAGAHILVRQRWLYIWTVMTPLTAWTPAEKNGFHQGAKRAIRRSWDNHARLRVSGTSDLARRLAGRDIPLRVDVQWVTASPHWTVTVQKVPATAFVTSFVVWDRRTITLDTNDLHWRNAASGEPGMNQMPVAHEFSHAFGNVPQRGHGDEYRADSPFNADGASIVNVGNTLRPRHFDHVVSELNQMVPNTSFAVSGIR